MSQSQYLGPKNFFPENPNISVQDSNIYLFFRTNYVHPLEKNITVYKIKTLSALYQNNSIAYTNRYLSIRSKDLCSLCKKLHIINTNKSTSQRPQHIRTFDKNIIIYYTRKIHLHYIKKLQLFDKENSFHYNTKTYIF